MRGILGASVLILWASTSAWAYPGFIGYGYPSCRTCHYNPLGNGPLTDYGRALGATVISGRPPFLSNKTTDDDLGNASGFFGKPSTLPRWLRLSGDYRGLLLKQGMESGSTPRTRYITMQAEGSGVLQLPDEKAYGVVTLGYVPPPVGTPSSDDSTLISREHYLAYQLTKGFSFYAGKMDAAFGLRVPDHIAYSRAKTRLAMNDQTHGLMVHYGAETWEMSVHYQLGNLSQDSSIRQEGASLIVEKDTGELCRLGLSLLGTQSDVRRRSMGAVHAKLGTGEGQSLLFESGLIDEKTPLSSSKGNYVFLQGMTRFFRGFHALMTLEYYTEDFRSAHSRSWRYTPGIQWFPFQRVEFRVDLQFNQVTGGSSMSPDTINLLSQVHLWL